MIDVGQTVGNYNVTAKLGEGGMGMVFLAEHPVIGSKVALKAIHPHFARNADVVSRFVTEARAVNQIGHDHIVNITDFGTTPAGDFYFIMEYLQGDMLSDWIDGHGAFPPARALHIAAQIADALQASHDQGVIHRDLKPDNVFLIARDTTLDFVKVLDFGLAKLTHTDRTTPTHNTGAGAVMGTPYYMAPEQCEGRATVDHRADIYALGVVLFEMLTGHVPFGGEGYGEVIIKHVTHRHPAARSLVPDLPLAMDALLDRALAKDPNDRFQSMAEFRAALLDSEGYLSALPFAPVHDDLSGRIRDAQPRARTEMSLAGLQGATRLERPAPPSSSTFRHAGEVVADEELKPKRNRGGLVFLGVAAMAGIAFAGMSMRRQASALLASAVAPARPATVRVNFSSDPAGATVSRSDGTVLGATPLSLEVPYSDAAIEYVVQKDGYASKTSSFIPNLPLSVFALLEKIEAPSLALDAPPTDDPPATEVASSARLRVPAASHRHRHDVSSISIGQPIIDDGEGDDVLAPSEP